MNPISVMIVFLGIIGILLIFVVTLSIKITKMKNRTDEFFRDNGENLEEQIKNYLNKVENVEKINKELDARIKNLETDIRKCVDKVGIIRYNPYAEMGSDLCFALAILDGENNGVVINSLKSREGTNIYAKPITKLESTYVLTGEERNAIDLAMGK